MMNKLFVFTAILALTGASVRQLSPEEADRLSKWKEGDKQDVWELSGQYQGDIVLNGRQRNGILSNYYRWPDKTIPYVFDPAITQEQRDYIIEAIKVFEEVSCMKTKAKGPNEGNYVYITSEDSGCWSYVGRQGSKQQLNLQTYPLGSGCFRPATIVHEFLHAAGFFHQQSSFERDDYVEILWDNIIAGKETNFDKYTNRDITNYGQPYDYDSVMHYGQYAFSANGRKTIIPKDPKAVIGQRIGMSEIDIIKLNKMFGCEYE